jgi:uracil-DNA glycosylase family 4
MLTQALADAAARFTVKPVLPRHQLIGLANCRECPCAVGGRAVAPVPGSGSVGAALAVVGEAPGPWEAEAGVPFVGKSGKLLERTLGRALGLRREAIYFTNTLLCEPTTKTGPSRGALAACAPRLRGELQALRNLRVILCVGAKAAAFLHGSPEPMARLNGQVEWNAEFGVWVVYAWHPAYILRSPNSYGDFAWAVGRVRTVLETGEAPAKERAIPHHVAGREDVGLLLAAHGQPTTVCDLETTGLDPYEDEILEIGLRWEGSEPLIIPIEVARDACWWRELSVLFADRRTTFVGHNYKFDVKFLRVAGFDARIGADTMLLHYCLDERSGGEGGGFHDLKTLAKRYLDAPEWESEVERLRKEAGGSMAGVPADIRRKYQAYDLAYTWELYGRFREELAKEPRSRHGWMEPIEVHDKLLVPLANALVDIELRGIRVDIERLPELKTRYRDDADALRAKLRGMVGAPKEFNPGSTVQVGKYLYGPVGAGGFGYPRIKGDSTDLATLADLARADEARGREPNQFLEGVTSYRSLRHTESTYIDGIAKRVRRDGRINSNLLLHGTVTGRLSSRDPNLQNLPADSVIKELFIPSEGRIMFNADYKQLEVRCLAWYSRDPALCAALRATDFHWEVAKASFPAIIAAMLEGMGNVAKLEKVAGMTAMFRDFLRRQSRPDERTDDPDVLFGWLKTRIRRKAKYVTFGNIYGEGPEALATEGRGLGCSVAEAAAFQASWRMMYPAAASYLEQQSILAKTTGWVEGYSGRRRRFNLTSGIAGSYETEGRNAPIQSFASDINSIALMRLNERLPAMGELGDALMPVHDSILGELDATRTAEGLEVVRETMTGVVVCDWVTFDVDIAVGPSWGAAH